MLVGIEAASAVAIPTPAQTTLLTSSSPSADLRTVKGPRHHRRRRHAQRHCVRARGGGVQHTCQHAGGDPSFPTDLCEGIYVTSIEGVYTGQLLTDQRSSAVLGFTIRGTSRTGLSSWA
jgi:hypothetical protein